MEIALINGFMIATAAFITVAGIVLAIGSGAERLSKYSRCLLIVSLALGVLLTVLTLSWLSNPPSSAFFAWLLLGLQFITFYYPMIQLAGIFARR